MELSDRDHDLMRRLVSGDLSTDAEAAREFFARVPGSRERLAELQSIAAALADESEERESVLREAATAPDSEDESRRLVDGFLASARAADAGSHPRSGSRRLVWFALAASLVLALGVAWWRSPNGSSPIDPVRPMGDGVRCVAPSGVVATYGRFEWRAPQRAGAYAELSIYVGRDDGAGDLVLREEVDGHGEWVRDPTRHPELPDRIVWRVAVFGLDGALIGTDETVAETR